MADPPEDVFYTSGRDVYCWAEQQSSVMLKAVTKHGDAVELTAIEAKELATTLVRLAHSIERD